LEEHLRLPNEHKVQDIMMTKANSSNNPNQDQKTISSASASHEAVDMTRRMVCGGISGMIAKTATNPLERIKMLSQTGEHGGKGNSGKGGTGNVSIINLYKSIIRNEGILGLWAGNGANLLRVFPAKAVVFSCNDKYRSFFYNITNTPSDQPLPAYLSFLAGGMSGMTATAATYPLDLARGRISGKLKMEGKQRHYNGIIRTILVTAKEEGVLALYKGVTPTVLGAMPYEGIKFGTVALMENLFPAEKKINPETGKLEKPSIWRKLCFGGMGGVMAGIITYPNDTVRRMLQLQGSRGTETVYNGYWDCVRQIYAKYGIKRFYNGAFINIIRMAPNTAVQFGSYELLKRASDDYF